MQVFFPVFPWQVIKIIFHTTAYAGEKSCMTLSRSSSMLSISLISPRSLAEFFSPAEYHAICLRISRTAVYSPLYFTWQIRMSEYCIPEQRQRRLIRQLPCFQKGSDLTKNKWIPPRCHVPIIMPSHPVCFSIAAAEAQSVISPFPMTGTETASLTCLMISQSALPA